jgi:dsRNA-specific ribonuclease
MNTNSSPAKTAKTSGFSALELFGDSWIRTLSMELLPLIFGPENKCLITFLLNHANSNKFYDQVAQYYELEKRISVLPEMHQIGLGQRKGAADIFEGWIASHIIERQFYDIGDPLYELRKFLKELWSLRYRDLQEYYCHSTILRKPKDTIKAGSRKDVNWITDDKLRRNLQSLDRHKSSVHMGYRITDDEVQYFIPGHRTDEADWTTYSFRDDPSTPFF